jgi:UDP-hydrolysing UDP-N-acetyl-D-glucosamine 2-epimerase
MKPVLEEIKARPELELQVVASGTMVLERFGLPVNILRNDGFDIEGEVYVELEGSNPTTMAKSVGFATIEFAGEFNRIRPNVVLLIGDRYEALAAAIAAAYMNLTIVHIQGGEVSGSIDESARHAISKFAHFHCPATERAAEYLVRMGERPDTIIAVGCPSSDIARQLDTVIDERLQHDINSRGRGASIDFSTGFQLVVFHPNTTEYGQEEGQIRGLLDALATVRNQTLLLWPNIDAGSDHISKEIRRFRDRHDGEWLRNLTNLDPEDYLKVLANAMCAIGNSSSFVRDASFFGTPVVLVGARQDGRERAAHVCRVEPNARAIVDAVNRQIAHGRYEPSTLYGDGRVAPRIASGLAEMTPYVQKRLGY